MDETQIESTNIKALSARIKILPFLHLGFAIINFLYLGLHEYLWDFCKKTSMIP
jgi:hypothetical protein